MREKRTRGPERIDEPEAPYQEFFAEWTWEPYDADGTGWVDYRLWMAHRWELDGTPLFTDAEADWNAPDKPLLDCEPLITGMRKFDGDTQWIGPENWYYDAEELERLFRAIRRMHIVAADIMGSHWPEDQKK